MSLSNLCCACFWSTMSSLFPLLEQNQCTWRNGAGGQRYGLAFIQIGTNQCRKFSVWKTGNWRRHNITYSGSLYSHEWLGDVKRECLFPVGFFWGCLFLWLVFFFSFPLLHKRETGAHRKLPGRQFKQNQFFTQHIVKFSDSLIDDITKISIKLAEKSLGILLKVSFAQAKLIT